jgi:hypothetical protein
MIGIPSQIQSITSCLYPLKKLLCHPRFKKKRRILQFSRRHPKDNDEVVDEKKDADESAVVEEVLANSDEVVDEENDAIVSTVVGEVLADLVTATSISISVFSYFGSRCPLVEDKDDGP